MSNDPEYVKQIESENDSLRRKLEDYELAFDVLVKDKHVLSSIKRDGVTKYQVVKTSSQPCDITKAEYDNLLAMGVSEDPIIDYDFKYEDSGVKDPLAGIQDPDGYIKIFKQMQKEKMEEALKNAR